MQGRQGTEFLASCSHGLNGSLLYLVYCYSLSVGYYKLIVAFCMCIMCVWCSCVYVCVYMYVEVRA